MLEAVKELVSSSSGGPETSIGEEGGLEKKLKANLTSYEGLLRNSRFGSLTEKIHIYKAASKCQLLCQNLGTSTLVLYGTFVVEAAALLAVLEELVSSCNEQDEQVAGALAAQVASGANLEGLPPPPSALLSVSEMIILHGLLEFVVSLGIFPFLLLGVDAHLVLRLKHAALIAKASNLCQDIRNAFLHEICSLLLKCCKNNVIGAHVIKHHLCDVLSGLIQVCYGPNVILESSGAGNSASNSSGGSPAQARVVGGFSLDGVGTKERCLELLHSLLRDMDQPLVIKELLVLQGLPSPPGARARSSGKSCAVGGSLKWLRKACGKMLSARLLCEMGVHHVITAILEITAGDQGT